MSSMLGVTIDTLRCQSHGESFNTQNPEQKHSPVHKNANMGAVTHTK